MKVSYQPLLPVYAAWSLEFVEALGVVFFQIDGTDINVIGSRLWRFYAINEALAELKDFPWRKRIEHHIIPPDPDGVFSAVFEEADIDCESCMSMSEVQTVFVTRELFPLLNIDNSEREWEKHDNNNAELIESVNGYRVERTKQSETFAKNPVHSWERYLVRALEVFAIWRYANDLRTDFKKPSNELYNRGVI